MAVYAIGDVQGCHEELRELLKVIKFNADRDRLWFCGDLVNRGPSSAETLRFVRSLQDNAVTVLGNHDLHLLATAYGDRPPGKKDTLDEILGASDAGELLTWLRHQPLIHRDKSLRVTMVHAGIYPAWSMKQARSYAGEVEDLLRSDRHVAYYSHMYGDKPSRWDDTLTGWKRYRFITNTFTRMRYCDVEGNYSLGIKCAPGGQPPGLFPWYEAPGRKTADHRIVFGHWSTLPQAGQKPINKAYAIDSGCIWGGKLTALRIDHEPFGFHQHGCRQQQKPSLKKA